MSTALEVVSVVLSDYPCPTAEDTMRLVIQFFLIGFKSASFAYACEEGILLEERWEWKWVEKHPEKKRERQRVLYKERLKGGMNEQTSE